MARYKLPNNVEKIKHLVMFIEDNIWDFDQDMDDAKLEKLMDACDGLRKWYCEAYGHDMQDDVCGIPEHRFCVVCNA